MLVLEVIQYTVFFCLVLQTLGFPEISGKDYYFGNSVYILGMIGFLLCADYGEIVYGVIL